MSGPHEGSIGAKLHPQGALAQGTGSKQSDSCRTAPTLTRYGQSKWPQSRSRTTSRPAQSRCSSERGSSLGMMEVFSCPRDLFSVLGRDPALTPLQDVTCWSTRGNTGGGPQIDPRPGPWIKERSR